MDLGTMPSKLNDTGVTSESSAGAHLRVRHAGPGAAASGHLPQQHAKGEDVGRLGQVALRQQLRRHVRDLRRSVSDLASIRG